MKKLVTFRSLALLLSALGTPAFAVAPPPPGGSLTTTSVTNSAPQAIPDPGVMTSTVTVSGANPYLWDVDLTTLLTHISAEELDITLTSPSGTVVTLTTDNGQGNSGVFNGTLWDDQADDPVTDHLYFDGVLASPLSPEEALGAFRGENPNGTWSITISDDTAGNGGALNSWTLDLFTLPQAPVSSTASFSNNTVTPIPDLTTTSSQIVVSGISGTLTNLTLLTHLRHAFSADLNITLTSPSGTAVTLTSNNGGGNDNVFNGTTWDDDANPGGQVPYTSNDGLASDQVYADLTTATPLAPEEPFSAFLGEDPNGTWTLSITDDYLSDTGTLDDWTLTISAASAADLSITKTDGVTNVFAGASTTYTITASNAGPNAASPATVTDTFPAACSNVSYTSVAAGGATGNTAAGVGDINDAALNLPVGASVTYTATCTVNASAFGTLSNTATIASAITDPVPGNNTATDADTITQPSSDLSITKTDGVTSVTPGSSTTYTIVASNAGPDAASPVTVTDTFPAACSSVSYTSVAAGGATGNTAAGSGNISDAALNLPAGASVTYTATCTVAVTASGTLSNTADIALPVVAPTMVSALALDPNPANNAATDVDIIAAVAASADLAITKTDGVTSVTPGASTTYTIVASNAGPNAASPATVTDTFPAACSSVSYTSVAAGGATGNTATGVGDINDAALNLPVGASVTYTATCTLDAAATGTLVNTATIASAITDPVPGNNTATDTDSITAVLTPVPTLSAWGAFLLTGLMGLWAFFARRRQLR